MCSSVSTLPQLLSQPDENSLRAPDVAELIRVLIPEHFADKRRAAFAESGERIADVVHGEFDALVTESVHRGAQDSFSKRTMFSKLFLTYSNLAISSPPSALPNWSTSMGSAFIGIRNVAIDSVKHRERGPGCNEDLRLRHAHWCRNIDLQVLVVRTRNWPVIYMKRCFPEGGRIENVTLPQRSKILIVVSQNCGNPSTFHDPLANIRAY